VADLGQPVHYLSDFLSELRLDVLDGDSGVLDHVVDEPTGNRHRIELQVDQNLRHFDAVGDKVLPGEPFLAHVGALAEAIGADEQVLIDFLGQALLYPLRDSLFFLHSASSHNSPASAKLM
jgi:hypothetical protein